MAHEQGLRVFRQASDDAREMAMRVSLIKVHLELFKQILHLF